MKNVKRNLLSVFLMAGVLCLAGCDGINLNNKTEEVEEDKRITVKIDTPKTSSISIDGDFIGSIESEEQVYVVSKLSGDVTDTFFEVGDYVNEGDLLFTIDDTAAQISYKQAKASLTQANATLNTAKAGVNTANASVNAAQASVNENFGKNSTNEKQLQMAIDSAEVSFANNEQNIGLLEKNINQLNEKIQDYEGRLDGARAFRDAAKADAEAHPLDLTKQKAYSDANTAYVQLEEGITSLKSNLDSVKVSYDTAKRSNCLVVEQADIARSNLSDYENYTRATIGNSGILTLTQAQAGVTQAEAGVVQSKAGITQAQAAVDAAQLQLDYANVVAPVSGIITSKGVTKNNMTSTGSVAYTIMSDGAKYVTFFVSESVMNELYEGQTITVDRNGNIYDAVITENPGVVDAQTGLFKIKARVNTNDDIVNGVKVKLTMSTKHADNVMTLPIDAVYHESEKSYVYTYSNGKANKVYVETGLFDEDVIEIVSGLSNDDQVIMTWSSQLRNGVEVKVENSMSANDNQPGNIMVERN